MSTSITINCKTYANVDEMPAADRALWLQAQSLLEQAEAQGGSQAAFRSSSVTVDGQSYGSQDALPPEVRARYQAAMAAMEGLLGPAAAAAATEPTRRPPDPIVIDERDLPRGRSGFVAGLLIGLVVALGALAAVYVLVR